MRNKKPAFSEKLCLPSEKYYKGKIFMSYQVLMNSQGGHMDIWTTEKDNTTETDSLLSTRHGCAICCYMRV